MDGAVVVNHADLCLEQVDAVAAARGVVEHVGVGRQAVNRFHVHRLARWTSCRRSQASWS